MLEQKDLQAIAELIDARGIKTETVLGKEINALDTKINTLDKKINALEDKINTVEKTLTNELVRTEDILTHKIEKVETELREMKEYYRINRIESGNVDLTLQILDRFQKRLEVLEKKFA